MPLPRPSIGRDAPLELSPHTLDIDLRPERILARTRDEGDLSVFEELENLPPHEFEEVFCHMLKQRGYSTTFADEQKEVQEAESDDGEDNSQGPMEVDEDDHAIDLTRSEEENRSGPSTSASNSSNRKIASSSKSSLTSTSSFKKTTSQAGGPFSTGNHSVAKSFEPLYIPTLSSQAVEGDPLVSQRPPPPLFRPSGPPVSSTARGRGRGSGRGGFKGRGGVRG